MISSGSMTKVQTEQIVTCSCCGSRRSTMFFCLPELPVHVGNFFDDAASARQVPRGNVELAYCHHCGHIFNRAFDPGLMDYRPGYEVALHHSPMFRDYMHSVAQRLIDQYQLHGKTIVEIGSGGAWFLALLCGWGGNIGIGIDPTTRHPCVYECDGFRMELIRDRFGRHLRAKFAEWLPDFVCCLSVLEHISKPRGLVRDLRSIVGSRTPTIYFEIFNAFRAFQRQEIWSVNYEQCQYFSEQSFLHLFSSSAFQILESGCSYGTDQYLYVDCVPDSGPCTLHRAGQLEPANRNSHHTPHETTDLPVEISQFNTRFHERCRVWEHRFRQYRQQGKRVVFWGTGGKGVTFLNACPSASLIEIVAEINPDKHGKFVPGSAQRIVAPEDLVAYRPDVLIVSNALYEQEVRQQAASLGLRCEFHVA
ncbi:MAG TPA: hypothetical protein PKD54_14180 [Pirellulaceae bacterium]|nr:hypothetical protein [Pirellulaceae bacterium]